MNTYEPGKPADEMIIRIRNDSTILIESIHDETISTKFINPDDLFNCIKNSCSHVGIESGILSENTVFYREEQDGIRRIIIKIPSGYHDIKYYETCYNSFPLPAMVFGFVIRPDGHISTKKLAVVEDGIIKGETLLYHYPFSNVNNSGHEICTGRNRLPVIKDLRLLASLPYHILAMPNNDDYFDRKYNRKDIDHRELLEYLMNKEPLFYYDEILIENKKTFNDFILILKS